MKPYYQDGGIALYHGDAMEVLPKLENECQFAVTITDPPYNVGLNYSGGDNRADYREWCESWLRLVLKPLIFTPGVVNLGMWQAIERPRWVCAWFKPNQASASALNGFNVWEPVLVYGKHRKPVGHDAWLDYISTAQRAGKDSEKIDHPCPKWLPFWTRLIAAFTEPGDLVVDPFMGSGTGARACANIGRRYIGIEIEERYCELSARRLSQMVLPFEDAA